MKPLTLYHARPLLPAFIVAVVLALLWAYATHSRQLHEPTHAAFALWLAVMFLLATIFVVFWTATVDIRPRAGASRRTFLAYALLSDLSGLLLLLIGVVGGLITPFDLLKLYALLISWLGLWTSITGALRRFGSGVAAIPALLLALLLLASPVLWSALHPFLSIDSVWQTRIGQAVGYLTPLTAALNALQPSLHLDWSSLPPFLHPGPDAPILLPPWWINAIAYGSLGIVLWLLRRPWQPNPADSLTRP